MKAAMMGASCATLGIVLADAVAAPPTYHVVPLTAPAEFGTTLATGIDNAGNVVGAGTAHNNPNMVKPLFWAAGTSTAAILQLPTSAGSSGSAFAVSNGGMIAGAAASKATGKPQLLRWNGDSTVSAYAGPNGSAPLAINDSGVTVGVAVPNPYLTYATLWDVNGTFIRLPALANSILIEATGINNAGVAVGVTNIVEPDGSIASHTVMWPDVDTVVDLGMTIADVPNGASAINDAGQIVGSTVTNFSVIAGYLYTPGSAVTPIPSAPDTYNFSPTRINASATVIGPCSTPTSEIASCIWTAADGSSNVATLVDKAGQRYTHFLTITGINDSGVLVGWYSNPNTEIQKAVMLVPE